MVRFFLLSLAAMSCLCLALADTDAQVTPATKIGPPKAVTLVPALRFQDFSAKPNGKNLTITARVKNQGYGDLPKPYWVLVSIWTQAKWQPIAPIKGSALGVNQTASVTKTVPMPSDGVKIKYELLDLNSTTLFDVQMTTLPQYVVAYRCPSWQPKGFLDYSQTANKLIGEEARQFVVSMRSLAFQTSPIVYRSGTSNLDITRSDITGAVNFLAGNTNYEQCVAYILPKQQQKTFNTRTAADALVSQLKGLRGVAYSLNTNASPAVP